MSAYTYYVTITDVADNDEDDTYSSYYSISITGVPTSSIYPHVRRKLTDDQIRGEVGEFLKKLGVEPDGVDFKVEMRARDEMTLR